MPAIDYNVVLSEKWFDFSKDDEGYEFFVKHKNEVFMFFVTCYIEKEEMPLDLDQYGNSHKEKCFWSKVTDPTIYLIDDSGDRIELKSDYDLSQLETYINNM